MSYPVHLLPDADKIKACLPSALTDMTVTVFDAVDSTNTEARRRLADHAPVPCLIVAHTQTGGRGRLGRSFHSPHGSGLYMTLAFDSSTALDRLAFVTPAAAVAAAQAISEVCGKEVSIKWVNDLYLSGRKIGGILTEAVPYEGGHHIILGIGINITTRDFPQGMRNPAGAVLTETEAPVDQSLLCARIVDRFMDLIAPENDQNRLAAYRSKLSMVGERVICTHHFPADGETAVPDGMEGTVMGVDEDYGLILRRDDGSVEILRGGEISVRATS